MHRNAEKQQKIRMINKKLNIYGKVVLKKSLKSIAVLPTAHQASTYSITFLTDTLYYTKVF